MAQLYASTVWTTGPKTARGVRMEERVAADPLDAEDVPLLDLQQRLQLARRLLQLPPHERHLRLRSLQLHL